MGHSIYIQLRIGLMHNYFVFTCTLHNYVYLHISVGEDYNPTLSSTDGELRASNRTNCHILTVYDDTTVEPPENVVISITAVGPPEFINLFELMPDVIVRIVDNDCEFVIIP